MRLTGVELLIVEDDDDSREILELVFTGEGASVRCVSSAKDALVVLKRWNPSAIISDISMPGGDGYTLMRTLRESGKQIPAIAITGSGKEPSEAIAAGFQLHIGKPFLTEQLVQVVEQLVKRFKPA